MNDDKLNRLNKAIDLGDEAAELFNHRMFKAAFDEMRADLFMKFGNSDELDDEGRRELSRSIKNLDGLERYFISKIERARMALKEVKSAHDRAKLPRGL